MKQQKNTFSRLLLTLLLLGQLGAAWAVRPIYLEPRDQARSVDPYLHTEISGDGKVTAVTAETVRINGVLYLLAEEGVEVKSAEYPYRDVELLKGMTVKFKGRKDAEGDGMASITHIKVTGN